MDHGEDSHRGLAEPLDEFASLVLLPSSDDQNSLVKSSDEDDGGQGYDELASPSPPGFHLYGTCWKDDEQEQSRRKDV